jgi:hypothetical protein
MSPTGIGDARHTQQTAAADQIAEARTAQAQPQKRAHFASLYKGKTTFAHVRAKRLATRRTQAQKLAQKLGTRKPGMAKTTRFAAPAKTAVRDGKAASKTTGSKKDEHRKVSRDQGKGGQGSQKDRQQGESGQQKKQQSREEQARREAKSRARSPGGVDVSKKSLLPEWLVEAAGLPDGAGRQQAIAEACCQALLTLRKHLGTPATPASGARIYLHMQQMQDVRSALGAAPGAGFGAVRQRLIEGASRRPAAEIAELTATARSSSSAPVDVASRDRLRTFNLLAGLLLMSGERPVTGHTGERAAGIVGSLVARREGSSGAVTE